MIVNRDEGWAVLGVPRCGSSWLHEILADRGEVTPKHQCYGVDHHIWKNRPRYAPVHKPRVITRVFCVVRPYADWYESVVRAPNGIYGVFRQPIQAAEVFAQFMQCATHVGNLATIRQDLERFLNRPLPELGPINVTQKN